MDEEIYMTKEERDALREIYSPYTDMMDDFISRINSQHPINSEEVTSYLIEINKEFGE